jgi:hypothetical protein
MKTSYFLTSFLTFLVLTFTLNGFSQIIGTKIDVQGTYYSDQMWAFSIPTCNRNFDTGWDDYKMTGTSSAPQIYAVEADGNYQVDAIPDFNNTYLAFTAGIDSLYTMTFTNQNFSEKYSKLYLIDSIANKTVEIHKSGTKYLFIAKNSISIKRFKIVTSITESAIVTSTIPDLNPEISEVPSQIVAQTLSSTTIKLDSQNSIEKGEVAGKSLYFDDKSTSIIHSNIQQIIGTK